MILSYCIVDEQKRFQEAVQRSHHYNPYIFVLETGLRTGELVGLTLKTNKNLFIIFKEILRNRLWNRTVCVIISL